MKLNGMPRAPAMEHNSSFAFVLRYHPVFRIAFAKALALVPFPRTYGILIRPAWSNALPSIAGSVESANNDLCRRVFGLVGSACVFPFNNTSAVSRHNFTLQRLHAMLQS